MIYGPMYSLWHLQETMQSISGIVHYKTDGEVLEEFPNLHDL